MDIKWSKTINLIDKDLQQNNKIKNVDFFTSLIDDNVLKKINPRRLVYYKKFVKTDKTLLRLSKTSSLKGDTKKAKKYFKYNSNKTSLDELIKIMMDSELKKYNE